MHYSSVDVAVQLHQGTVERRAPWTTGRDHRKDRAAGAGGPDRRPRRTARPTPLAHAGRGSNSFKTGSPSLTVFEPRRSRRRPRDPTLPLRSRTLSLLERAEPGLRTSRYSDSTPLGLLRPAKDVCSRHRKGRRCGGHDLFAGAHSDTQRISDPWQRRRLPRQLRFERSGMNTPRPLRLADEYRGSLATCEADLTDLVRPTCPENDA